MPKYKIICFLLAAVMAAVGTVLVVKNLGSEEIPTFEKPIEDLNTYLDRTEDIDIDDSNTDVRQFLFVAHKVLLQGEGFYGVAEGTSTAVGVKQYVRNTRYVVGEFGSKNTLKEMVTKGVVGKAYQLYMWDNNYIYRKGTKINSLEDVTWATSAQALSEDAFYNDFGHRNDKLTGYILNWDTVTNGEFVEKNDGVYTFRYVLDADAATTYLRREMIFNGGLNSEPSFIRCVIYVSMDSDFNVVSLRTDCEYKAQTMGINATCTEDITEYFQPYDGELPEKEFYEQYFTENPDSGIEDEQTALDVLMEMFSPYLGGEPLQVAVDASANGESVVNGLVSIDGLDISDLSKLTVNARIGNLNLAYVHGDGAIYLKYQDFQGSTTVDGIKELVATLAPLFGSDDVESVALDDFDIASLLDNLTYTVNGDKVVVSLPISLGGLEIDAKLNGNVNGDTYTFSNAVINIGDVEIFITPSAWTVAERTGAYPEILGLVDILQNGKIALNANLTLGNYAVEANVLVDLATRNLELNVQLGNNGTVSVVCVDGIAYAKFGEVKVKLDTANIDTLLEIISSYTSVKFDSAVSMDITLQSVLELLSSISATKTDSGVAFKLSVMGVDVALNLANNNGRWQLGSITASADGVNTKVVGADALGEVNAPSDIEAYADITELVETFAAPLFDIINGNVYGANFNATLTLGSKLYSVKGSVRVDLNNTLKLNATVYDGNLGIIDAQVIYANNTVFLTLNGIKVAFAVDGSSSNIDILAKLGELLDNEQIKDILASHEEIAELVEQVSHLVSVATNFTLDDLLNVDFTTVITAFRFDNGELCISLNGDALRLNGIALDITLANRDGRLAVGVFGLKVASVGLDISADVINTAETIAIPKTDEYMLNIAGEILGAELQVTLDLVHMDIWASVKYGNNLLLARFVDGKIYVQYAGLAVVLDTGDLEEIINKLGQLSGKIPNTDSFDIFKVLSVLSAIKADLTGETPNISLDIEGVKASINFVKVDNKLVFNDIFVSFKLDGKEQKTTLAQQTKRAEQLDVSGEFVGGKFVDLAAVILDFAEPVSDLINAEGYTIGIYGSISLDGRVYSFNATVKFNTNVYVFFELSYQNVRMIDGELWLVDNILYLQAGDLRLALPLGEDDTQATGSSIQETLESIKGYNGYVDEIVELVLKIMDMSVEQIDFEQLLSSLTYNNGKLTLGVDGQQFGLSYFTLGLGKSDTNGISLSVEGLSYKSITVRINNALVVACNDSITVPGGDFSTNLVIDVQDYDSSKNTSGEHNVIYVNLDLLKGVVLARIETTMPNGSKTFLDVKYTFADKVLKLTNGDELNVLVNINNIADIVDRINDIVNEFANAGDQALPDLFGSLGGDIDLKAILNSLSIESSKGQVLVGLNALGMNITAIFQNGLKNVTVPVDIIESNLVVSFSGTTKATYSDFSDNNSDYVSVDQVFDDYYYGEDGTREQPNGAIYNLVHTNSWKFDFLSDSEIDVLNEDGTTTKYQIITGSYLTFYFNKTEKENIKLRAKLTVQKNGGEFLYLDAAFIDGRIYATYDSRKSGNNKNELRATVSLEAIKDTIDLLPALIKVVPQIGTLIDDMKDAMSSMESKLTLGNVSKILQSVSYGVADGKNVFTLEINGQAIDSNNFGKDPITLKVSNYGSDGLSLDQLSLSYGKVSVNIVNLVVTGSPRNEATGEFKYVEDYIYTYDTTNHINFDSIRELLSAFIITADNVDVNGNRSFTIEGTINATLLKNQAIIGITIYVDIDKDNNVYLAVKISRDAKGILSGQIYADDGGYSYMLLNTKDSTISLYRNSYSDYTYCSRCKSWTCTSTILHAGWRKKSSYLDTEAPVGNQLPSFMIEKMAFSEFTADTKTMVGYILDTLNFGSIIENQIRGAIGKENNNVYGIEDIFKSYTYNYSDSDAQGTFAIKVDLSPIDSALGEITANIIHVGNFDDVSYDEDGNFNDGGVKLTQIKGTATMISIMDATYELKLLDPISGLAISYVTNGNYLW